MTRWLYFAARLINDYQAIRRGRIGPRLWNKLVGRYLVSKVWR
jgi:hypothetical protein